METLKQWKKKLEEQQYRLVGPNQHSAVKVCHWTKESLKDEDFCYKQKFYGIKSHRCLQMSPCIACNFRCRYCWRAHPSDLGLKQEPIPQEWDDPGEIIDAAIEKQRDLISGFKGNPDVNMEKFKEAQNPNQAAISLTGEPVMYPKIGELIKAFHERAFTTFLVTNGAFPERLREIPEPTNLYISLDAPNKELFNKIDRPRPENAWEKLNESLDLLSSFSNRTLSRITLIKNLNMKNPEAYARLLDKYEPDFVECKAYMAVGFSQKRLDYEQMPRHSEVKKFAREIAKNCDYEIKNEKEESRVVLLS